MASQSNVKSEDSENQSDNEEESIKIKRCPHIHNIKKKIKGFKTVICGKCDAKKQPIDQSLIFCLSCFKLNCSRSSPKMHGFNHYKNTKNHNLCMTIPSFEEFNENSKEQIMEMLTIWCYKCDHYLYESEQNESPKIQKIKYEIYGHLSRSYKKLSNQCKKTHKKNGIKSSKNTNKSQKNGDKYAKYKNKYAANQNQRQLRSKSDNLTTGSLEKWSKLNENVVSTMNDENCNGFIGVFGLSNLGNTCFFNSIIQNLAECRPLIHALFEQFDTDKLDQKKEENMQQITVTNTKRGKKRNNNKRQQTMNKKLRGRLLSEFHRVICDAKSVANSYKNTVVPNGLLNAVVARNRRFAGRRQQDSHELMRVLVEGMRDQNVKIIKKERENRLYANLATWTLNDVIEWFAFYEIILDKTKIALTVDNFSNFIKTPNKYGINKFFSQICIDESCQNLFEKGRIFLVNEECDFYCAKHGISIVAEKDKNYKKIKRKNDNVNDNEINTIIDDVFMGKIESCVTCFGCGNISKMSENFYDLSLPISCPKKVNFSSHWNKKRNRKKPQKKMNEDETKNDDEMSENENESMELPKIRGMDRLKGNVNLMDVLSAFTDAELLSGCNKYGCKECTKLDLLSQGKDENEIEELLKKTDLKTKNAKKQILISKAPKVLCLHLKRFEQSGYRLSKVGKRVSFPLHFDLSPYMSVSEDDSEEREECVYQLFGISVHHGSMGGGHYIAYTHKHRENGPKDGWYYFSDSTTRKVDYKDVLRAQAYVLFYQKCERRD